MSSPRVVSLIASSTEIVCALGLQELLVGRSHECDYPPGVERLPVCTQPKFADGTSYQIDERIKAILQEGLSVYRVEADTLESLAPDVIITQTQCDVCAVSLADVDRGLVVSADLRRRIDEIEVRASRLEEKPTVACIEWIDPLMAAGNWMPELVELAGGRSVVGRAGEHAPWLQWEELVDLDPDVIVAMPCGFDIARTRRELSALTGRKEWQGLRAVSTGRTYLADGNQFFNRPGPRVVEALEIMAEMLHPVDFEFGHRGSGWQTLDQEVA